MLAWGAELSPRQFRLVGLYFAFFVLFTITFASEGPNYGSRFCLSPYQLIRGNFLGLFSWIFFEQYGFAQLAFDLCLMFICTHLLHQQDFPSIKFALLFALAGYGFALAARQLTVQLLLMKDFFHDSFDNLHRACAGGLSPFLTVLVGPATFSQGFATSGPRAMGGLSAILVATLMAIKMRRLAWVIVYNVGAGLILYVAVWLRRNVRLCPSSRRQRLCSLYTGKLLALEATRFAIFAAASTFIVVLALGSDMPRFALDGFRDIAVDPNERPVYSSTDFWEWSEADYEAIKGVRQLKELTPAQIHSPRHRQSVSLPPPREFPGYHNFQVEVFKRQYPMSCDNKKFLAYRLTASGAGDDLHRMAWGLGVALATDRIFILDPNQTPWAWADPDFCGSVLLPECYFKPFTNCSLPDDGSRYVHQDKGVIPAEPVIVYTTQICGEYSCPYLPKNKLQSWVPGVELTSAWWHTVTTGFFWRPNPRMKHFLQQVYDHIYGANRELIRRSFGIHVRHGDKYKEMKLHPLADYLTAAENIKKSYGYMAQSDVILLSTEDPEVIADAEAWNESHRENGTQWQFVYLNDHKENDQYIVSHARWHFVNAFLAAQADAFVLTTASNWCRVINELRRVDGKADYPLADLEFKAGWQ